MARPLRTPVTQHSREQPVEPEPECSRAGVFPQSSSAPPKPPEDETHRLHCLNYDGLKLSLRVAVILVVYDK